jgi:hypothetical protein
MIGQDLTANFKNFVAQGRTDKFIPQVMTPEAKKILEDLKFMGESRNLLKSG